MRSAEIVIIGGGVVGASIAYHLAERGVKDVMILEREKRQGTGSTGKATGGVRAQFETDVNILMSLYSINFFENCDFYCGYDPKGYLLFATDDRQLDYLKRNVARQRELGVKGVGLLDASAVKELIPALNCDDIVGGTFGERDGFIDPLAVMNGFTARAVDRGVQIEFGADARSIDVEGERVRSVSSSKGKIACSTAVICTGAWAKDLAFTAGVALPVEPMRRQIVWARTAQPLPPDLPMVIDLGSGFHFRPAREFGNPVAVAPRSDACRDVLFAYPDPSEQPSLITDFEQSFVGKVYEKAKHRAPFLCDSEPVLEKCRAGLYENTPDHHAILGGCEVEGLYFANGFSGHGVMHSPATGRALAEIIVEGKAGFLDVSCLSIERFVKGELLHETAFI
jgi:sarcosine oxidase subunit beta